VEFLPDNGQTPCCSRRQFAMCLAGSGVTKLLPHNGSEFEYRIKSASEEHERVARESEMTRA